MLQTLSCILLLCTLTGCFGPRAEEHPRATLDAYVAAIHNNDSAAAYRLLDEKTRQRITEAEFRQRWNETRKEQLAQAKALKIARNKPLEIHARITHKAGTDHVLSYGNGRWMVDSAIGGDVGATPQSAITALMLAVERRDYRAVTDLLAAPVVAAFEKQIERRIAHVRNALKNGIKVQGSRATLQDGSFKLELIKEGGRWKVYDFD
jgi:hypothetical protein